MFTLKTITGETLDDFFVHKVPTKLHRDLINKLQYLRNHGRQCVGAFVFEEEKIYYFSLDEDEQEALRVYLAFIDLENLIMILKVQCKKAY